MGLKAGKYHTGAQIFNGGQPKTAPVKENGKLNNAAYHGAGVDFQHQGAEGWNAEGQHRVAGHAATPPMTNKKGMC